jgi:hypothetical protein
VKIPSLSSRGRCDADVVRWPTGFLIGLAWGLRACCRFNSHGTGQPVPAGPHATYPTAHSSASPLRVVLAIPKIFSVILKVALGSSRGNPPWISAKVPGPR